jgi:hypothetical protein
LTSSATFVDDVKDHDELVNDLRIDVGGLRIDLIVDPRRPSSATLKIMMNPSATLASTSAASELTSPSILLRAANRYV